MAYRLIESVDQLKLECLKQKEEFTGFIISLAGGLARSSKRIHFDSDNNLFDVHNEIDDSFQENLSEDDLRTKTMIIEAIDKKAFYLHQF